MARLSSTGGYGIIARDSGSTLWGQRITPVIISAIPYCQFYGAAMGAGNAFCDIEFAASTAANQS